MARNNSTGVCKQFVNLSETWERREGYSSLASPCSWSSDVLTSVNARQLETNLRLRTPVRLGVGARWRISAVARIYKPGAKADCCLIWEGAQETKKSTALKILEGDWFTDETAELGSKDAAIVRGTPAAENFRPTQTESNFKTSRGICTLVVPNLKVVGRIRGLHIDLFGPRESSRETEIVCNRQRRAVYDSTGTNPI